MPSMKVGLIVDAGAQPYLVWDLVEKSKRSDDYSIDLLIVQQLAAARGDEAMHKVYGYVAGKGVRRFLERLMLAAIQLVEKLRVAGNPGYKAVLRQKPLNEIAVPTVFVTPVGSGRDPGYRYSEQDIERIRSGGLDVLVRCGSGRPGGEIRDICKHGILSFRHASSEHDGTAPPGFGEVLERRPSTGFMILRQAGNSDADEVLFKGELATCPVYVENLCKLYAKSNVFMDHVLKRIAGDDPPAVESVTAGATFFTAPSVLMQFKYLYRTAWHTAKKAYWKLTSQDWRWGVAYQHVDDWMTASLSQSQVIDNPANGFLADPFVFRKDGQDVIFVEEYDYGRKLGHIAAYEVSESGYEALGNVLVEPFHLSYPFLLEADGKLFMCPETSEARDIRMYECVEFPLKWKFHEVLIPNVSATDSSIFFRDGYWWLLTNIDTADLGDFSSELHVFYADRFDSENWHRHPSNPVVFDSNCARNGGLLFDEEGAVYRVFQRQGFDIYGEAMGVAKIDVLTPTDYAETVVLRIEPDFFDDIGGTHTYSCRDRLMALDFVKMQKVPR